MLKQMSVVAISLAALPALAEAQQPTSARAMVTQGVPLIAQAPAPSAAQIKSYPSQAAAPADAGGTMKDEYGNMYNSRGDRIDRSGRILPPPVTPPGARALR
jgi:hypothetical protein